jgi:arabinose-5-phosphate isomerase
MRGAENAQEPGEIAGDLRLLSRRVAARDCALSAQQKERLLERAREVLRLEAKAVSDQAGGLNEDFSGAVSLLLGITGRVVVTGMGKSGLVGRKISATLSSTGTPSLFMHPAEAMHGDLGMVAGGDAILLLSASGETEEIKKALPVIRAAGLPLVAMTCRKNSTLGRNADAVLEIRVEKEACRHNLVPTSSTTAMLAVGDALALSIMDLRGFGPEDFARFHPGGSLGRRLNALVGELMRRSENSPEIFPEAPLSEALLIMTSTRLGAVSIIDRERLLLGFFTDGDLRRVLRRGLDMDGSISALMTKNPLTISPDRPAREAAAMMHRFGCDNLPVVDAQGRLLGILDEKDLIDSGISV